MKEQLKRNKSKQHRMQIKQCVFTAPESISGWRQDTSSFSESKEQTSRMKLRCRWTEGRRSQKYLRNTLYAQRAKRWADGWPQFRWLPNVRERRTEPARRQATRRSNGHSKFTGKTAGKRLLERAFCLCSTLSFAIAGHFLSRIYLLWSSFQCFHTKFLHRRKFCFLWISFNGVFSFLFYHRFAEIFTEYLVENAFCY